MGDIISSGESEYDMRYPERLFLTRYTNLFQFLLPSFERWQQIYHKSFKRKYLIQISYQMIVDFGEQTLVSYISQKMLQNVTNLTIINEDLHVFIRQDLNPLG